MGDVGYDGHTIRTVDTKVGTVGPGVNGVELERPERHVCVVCGDEAHRYICKCGNMMVPVAKPGPYRPDDGG